MDSLNLKPHEETFEVKPIGIRYRCEFCNEGEMVTDNLPKALIESGFQEDSIMIPHTCSKCGKQMLLPRVYPYVQFIPVEKVEKKVDTPRYNFNNVRIADAVAVLVSRYSLTDNELREKLFKDDEVEYAQLIADLKKYDFLIRDENHNDRWLINHTRLHDTIYKILKKVGYNPEDVVKRYMKNKDVLIANAALLAKKYEWIRTDFFLRHMYTINKSDNNYIIGQLKKYGVLKQLDDFRFSVSLDAIDNLPVEILKYM